MNRTDLLIHLEDLKMSLEFMDGEVGITRDGDLDFQPMIDRYQVLINEIREAATVMEVNDLLWQFYFIQSL